MISRKLQSTGGSSYSLTLPKKWLQEHHLDNKSQVYLVQSPQHLTILPQHPRFNQQVCHLSINTKHPQHTKREIVAAYLAGYQHVILTAEYIDTTTKEALLPILSSLMGFEVVEDTAEKIIIQNVFDPTKFPVLKNLESMFEASINMIADAYEAFKDQDEELAKDVIARDQNVDRLYFALMRQYQIALQPQTDLSHTSIPLGKFKQYALIGLQLERMADHATKIATMTSFTSHANLSEVKNINPLLKNLLQNIRKLNTPSKDVPLKYIHQIYDTVLEIQEEINNQRMEHQVNKAMHTFYDSFDRINSYIINICDYRLDLHFMGNSEKVE